ncbi:hypothetical protein DK873_00505 [Lactobacillus melliventris]|uniref:Uncharacterized protein n=1 Tax=Lactobacillus melliventris TaxID=1218507 RepID=A0ABX5N2S4_9LACO|nr:hypothetical protein DK873_00505 [Lactobacillus melliventris]
MFTLLLILFLIWLFVKMGIGIFKILFFLLTCALTFFFFVQLLIPVAVFLGVIFLIFAIVRR